MIRKEHASVFCIFPFRLFRQVRQVLDFPHFPHASLSFSPELNITVDSQKHTQCCVYSVSRCRFSFWQTGCGSNVTVKYATDQVEVASTTQRLWLCFGDVCYRAAFSSVLKINQECCHIFFFPEWSFDLQWFTRMTFRTEIHIPANSMQLLVSARSCIRGDCRGFNCSGYSELHENDCWSRLRVCLLELIINKPQQYNFCAQMSTYVQDLKPCSQ